MKLFCRKRAQVLTEYAIVFALVLAAFVAVQTYAKRGIQAVVKDASDEIGFQEAGEKKNFLDYKGEEDKSSSQTTSESKRDDWLFSQENGAEGIANRDITLEETTREHNEAEYRN